MSVCILKSLYQSNNIESLKLVIRANMYLGVQWCIAFPAKIYLNNSAKPSVTAYLTELGLCVKKICRSKMLTIFVLLCAMQQGYVRQIPKY